MEELTSAAWKRLENATGMKPRVGSNPTSSAWKTLLRLKLRMLVLVRIS